MSSMSVTDLTADERRIWLGVLAAALHGHGYDTEFDQFGNLVVIQPNQNELRTAVLCQARASDEGRLWFLTTSGHPLAAADNAQIMNAITEVKGLLAC